MCEIKVGSVTNAQRGARTLRRMGIGATLSRIENPSASDGCGFVLRVKCRDVDKATDLLYQNGIRVLGTVEK